MVDDTDTHSDERDPDGTMRMRNAPRHGPLTLLRKAWERYREMTTEQQTD